MDAFLAEIRIFGFDFAPRKWLPCNGQILPITQYTALFSLIGTNYGGDGVRNFALPNLAACVPLQAGQAPGLSNYDLGETGGTSAVTVTGTEMAAHTHALVAAEERGDTEAASGGQLATAASGPPNQADIVNLYSSRAAAAAPMSPRSIVPAGGGRPHNNMQPYLSLNFCIAIDGIYPQRS